MFSGRYDSFSLARYIFRQGRNRYIEIYEYKTLSQRLLFTVDFIRGYFFHICEVADSG